MLPVLFLVAGVALLPILAVTVWRFQVKVLRALVPGAAMGDVTSLADLPLGAVPALVPGPQVRLLTLIREATSLFVAYRPVTPAAAEVSTQVLDLAGAGNRELAVLARWHAGGTPVMVWADLVAGQVAIQEPRSLLTVTLPVLS